MLDRWMTKLAYSRVLSERFQLWHLIINYSILVLACLLYLAGVVGVFAIAVASWPGALVFIVSAEALSYRKAIEGGDLQEILQAILPQR